MDLMDLTARGTRAERARPVDGPAAVAVAPRVQAPLGVEQSGQVPQ